MASTFADLYIHEQKKRLSYHGVSSLFENGRKYLKAREIYATEYTGGWNFLTGFAVCNSLSIINNDGVVIKPTLCVGLTCGIIQKELMFGWMKTTLSDNDHYADTDNTG